MGTSARRTTAPVKVASVRALIATAVCVLVVFAGMTTVLWPGATTSDPVPQIPGSPAAPTADEITPVCTTTTPAAVLGPSPSLPANPTSTLVNPSDGVVNFAATSSDLYVNTGTRLITYTLSGSEVTSFALPFHFTGNSASPPVVDPSGDIYLASYYGQLVDKFSPSGALLWSADPQGGNPIGLFSVGSGSGFQLVVSLVQDTKSSLVLDQWDGSVSGTFSLVDHGFVTQESDGNLLYSANGYVETVDPSGQVLSTFGSSHIEGAGVHTGSGTQFYYPAQAVQGPDGTIYTADPLDTVEATSPAGYFQSSTTFGGDLAFGGWNFALVGSIFYYQSGPPFDGAADSISTFSLATLQTYLNSIQAPSNTLGWGAGLSTPATGNYFAPGATPIVDASFDPWWTEDASHLGLSYLVEDTASLDAGTMPTSTVVPLPTSAAGLATVPLTIPADDTVPGPYQVQATLLDNSTDPPTILGTTCMPYTVGAPGDRLDFAALPPGAGSGGPADPRGVVLNSQLGLSGLRSLTTVDWASVLPACNAAAPTTATCGPSAMTFASSSDDPYQAAYLANRDNVTYWMQISGGEPVGVALVDSGLWQRDVAALVAHYATVPAGCGNCAPVTNWEPWNEPNNTGWPDGATYTTKVLAPFYAAVKSVEPGSSSTVIGGSTLGPSAPWWQQLVAAGGLADMDVAAIHPYPGSNDSYEEDGMPVQIGQVQSIIGSKPLWFTEIGWWSNGDYDFLSQANNMARSLIWQKVLGVPVENYFFDEGSFGNDGVSFSLIQATGSDDYVKPAALATMTATGALVGRPYLSMPDTGIPQSYQAEFGPTSGGTTDMAAVWTDGLSVTASVTLNSPSGSADPITVTDEYGGTTDVQATSGTAYSLPLSDQVQYLTYPAGDTLSIGPTETYGTDLASSAAGATATASSGNASAAIAGLTVGYGQGWSSEAGDTTPSLTVTLAAPATIDRVIVDTQSVGSTASGIRDYTLSADEPGTGWVAVAPEANQFRDHEIQFALAPVTVDAVRIDISEINFGGYYGGGIPPWWPTDQGATAFLHAIQVYAGTGGPSVVDGSGLPPLLTQVVTPPTTTTTTDPGPPPNPTPPSGDGYRLVTSAAQVTAFGSDTSFGPDGAMTLNRPIVGLAATRDGQGYWLVGSDGGVFNFGDAGFYGSIGDLGLNAPIVGMAATADDAGYWLVGSDGGIFASGDAQYLGSTGGMTLNRPVVGMAATPDGGGYWLVASDGGIFAFGDAGFYGSTGGMTLNKPIVGMAATPDGKGYWLVASDGGIFAFGDAAFYGSTGGMTLNKPIVGMAATPDGGGYWLVASDGGIFAFGDAEFYGSAATATDEPIVGIAAG